MHAPMTRLRAEADETPSATTIEYYCQRTSPGGLLITESSHPLSDSHGHLGAPGIHTRRHVERWRKITDAVHQKDGRILM